MLTLPFWSKFKFAQELHTQVQEHIHPVAADPVAAPGGIGNVRGVTNSQVVRGVSPQDQSSRETQIFHQPHAAASERACILTRASAPHFYRHLDPRPEPVDNPHQPLDTHASKIGVTNA